MAEIKKLTKENVAEVLEQEGGGFDSGQLKKAKRFLNRVFDNLSGKFCSMGSGGGFCHMFFQQKDGRWIGMHNVDNGAGYTLSKKAYKTPKSLERAFWEDEDKIIGEGCDYKPQKVSHKTYIYPFRREFFRKLL